LTIGYLGYGYGWALGYAITLYLYLLERDYRSHGVYMVSIAKAWVGGRARLGLYG
jgi:hypothetical protein